MSTDDLVRRARAEVPTFALVSELADEVDQLRGKRVLALANEDYWLAQHEARRREIDGLVTERDAARAALERVREVVEDGDRLDGLWIYAPDLDRALEGES